MCTIKECVSVQGIKECVSVQGTKECETGGSRSVPRCALGIGGQVEREQQSGHRHSHLNIRCFFQHGGDDDDDVDHHHGQQGVLVMVVVVGCWWCWWQWWGDQVEQLAQMSALSLFLPTSHLPCMLPPLYIDSEIQIQTQQ